MRSHLRYRSHNSTLLIPFSLTVVALLIICFAALAQTPITSPSDARGVIRLRARAKSGDTTKGLSRKRFFLIKGTLEQNKPLVQATEAESPGTRDCYYRNIGASEALMKWLRESDCESVYCREIEQNDLAGTSAVPEFQRALAVGEQELGSKELARKWLTVNLPETVRDGYYKLRQRELLKLIAKAEETSGAQVQSVMTDTKGTAYFTDLPLGTYVISNLLPIETANSNIIWNCEIQVKPGDLANEKAFTISNVRGDKSVKCVGTEKPSPVCEPAQRVGQKRSPPNQIW